MYEDFNNSNIYDNSSSENNGGQMVPNGFIPEEPKKPKKKKGGARKVALLTAAALLFGAVSGSTMVGVNMLADYFNQQQNPTRTELTTVPAGGTDDGSDSSSGDAASGTQMSATLDVSSIVEKAMPSVVAINNRMVVESNNWFFGPQQYDAGHAHRLDGQRRVLSAGAAAEVGASHDNVPRLHFVDELRVNILHAVSRQLLGVGGV